MRAGALTSAGLAALLCCSPSPRGDAGMDAGGPDAEAGSADATFDSAEADDGALHDSADVASDAPSGSDAPLPTTWSVEVFSTEPCEPWGGPELPVPTLPADPSVRALWTWDAASDPEFLAAAPLGLHHLDSPALAPDGTLRLFGPDGGAVTALARDGTLLWVASAGVLDSEGGFYGPPVVTPDGTTWLVRPATPSRDAQLIAYSADGAIEEALPLPFIPPGSLSGPVLMAGPGGRLYVGFGALYATCRGRRLLWRAVGPGTASSVTPTGDVWVPAYPGGLVASDGAFRSASIDGLPGPTGRRTLVRPRTTTLYSVESSDGDPSTARLWYGAPPTLAETLLSSELGLQSWELGPDGAVWTVRTVGPPEPEGRELEIARHEAGSVTARHRGRYRTSEWAWTAAGEPIVASDEPRGVARLLATGGTSFVPVPVVHIASALRDDAVLYVIGAATVTAVQFDALPSIDASCVTPRCSGRLDAAMSYFRD